MDLASSMYRYVRLNRVANCFFPVESKDCMNSASYEYRKMSVRKRGTIRTNWNADYLLEIQIETSTKMYTPFLIGLN